jgi:hypothetical protein
MATTANHDRHLLCCAPLWRVQVVRTRRHQLLEEQRAAVVVAVREGRADAVHTSLYLKDVHQRQQVRNPSFFSLL